MGQTLSQHLAAPWLVLLLPPAAKRTQRTDKPNETESVDDDMNAVPIEDIEECLDFE